MKLLYSRIRKFVHVLCALFFSLMEISSPIITIMRRKYSVLDRSKIN